MSNMNQAGPFWDFLSSLENTDLSNHPFFRHLAGSLNANHSGAGVDHVDAGDARDMNAQHGNEQYNTNDNNANANFNNDWDAFAASFPFGAGFPFGGGRGRGGWGGRGRGGFGGPRGRGGHGPHHGPPGPHHGPPGPSPPPPPPGGPHHDHPMPPPPPPHPDEHWDVVEDPPIGTPPSSDDEHEPERNRSRSRHEHGHGRGRNHSHGRSRGRGHGHGRGRGGHRGGHDMRGAQFGTYPFNMAGLAEFLQSQFSDGGNNNTTSNVFNTTTRNVTSTGNGDFQPPTDIFITPTQIVIDVSLPGAKKEDTNVSFNSSDSILTISGVVHRKGDEDFISMLSTGERKIGMFERQINLGNLKDADWNAVKCREEGVVAKLEDGVLRVSVQREMVSEKEQQEDGGRRVFVE